MRDQGQSATVQQKQGYSHKEELYVADEVQPQDGQGQSLEPENGQQVVDQQPQNQPPEPETGQSQQELIDYEKAYKNLEKDYTKKAQRLKEVENWVKFQEQTGVTADQALQQLEAYQRQFAPPAYPQPQQPSQTSYQAPAYQQPYTQYNNNPEVDALKREMAQFKKEQQVTELRQKFPNFDEYYADVMSVADEQNLDLETAFGKVLVTNWDNVTSKVKQQTVDTIRAKGTKAVEPSSAPSPADQTVDLTNEEREAARLMGVPEEEYAKMKGADVTL